MTTCSEVRENSASKAEAFNFLHQYCFCASACSAGVAASDPSGSTCGGAVFGVLGRKFRSTAKNSFLSTDHLSLSRSH
eukprot:509612-Amphidinium_carterae.1